MVAIPHLRADARRNVEGIRTAALKVFQSNGLQSPLDEVARLAGVSKGTIYHRFGGRQGLIDAVVDELVADRLSAIIAHTRTLEDPVERFESYLRHIWMLQYDEPAANDVLLRADPDSSRIIELCEYTRSFGEQLLSEAQATGTIRSELTGDDVSLLIWERGIVARASDQQSRDSYERRISYVLDGLRQPL